MCVFLYVCCIVIEYLKEEGRKGRNKKGNEEIEKKGSINGRVYKIKIMVGVGRVVYNVDCSKDN